MADSTTHLDVINGARLQREVIFNELMDALSPATFGGRRASGCDGLVFLTYTSGHFELTPSTTNYIVAALDDQVITHSTADTNWNDTDNYARLYKIVTDTTGVVSYEDHRQIIGLALPE